MAAISTNISSAFIQFEFTDEEGNVAASFRMNPADVKLAKRCEDVSAYFNKLGDNMPESATLDDAWKLNDEIEDKICYLLGYDAKRSLFGQISATSIIGDGNLFVTIVMDKILEHVAPEIQKRKIAMAEAVNRHTEKYRQ